MTPFRKPFTVTRSNPGTRDSKGRWQAAATPTANFATRATVRPWGARSYHEADKVIMLELGLSSLDGMLVVYSDDELYTARKSPAAKADRFTHNGQVYQILGCSHFGELIPHWRSVAGLVDEKTP